MVKTNPSSGAWLHELGEELMIGELCPSPLRTGQVKVKVSYSGVCHSQLMEMDGLRGEDKYIPHLLGHEATGIVIQVGRGVCKVQVGQPVILTWIKGIGYDVPGGEAYSNGLKLNAGPVTTFSQVTIVSENRVVPLPNGVPMDAGVLFGCALPTGLGMVKNELKPEKGESAVIFGLGGVGLCALMGLVESGCEPIIAVDPSEAKRTLALKIGATHTICPNQYCPIEFVKKQTGGGADCAIDAAGKCQTTEAAFKSIKRGSGKCIFASHPPNGDSLSIDPFELICGKRIMGSWGGGCEPDRDLPLFGQMYVEGKLPLELLITKKYPLNNINQAMKDLREGNVCRPLIEMNSKSEKHNKEI